MSSAPPAKKSKTVDAGAFATEIDGLQSPTFVKREVPVADAFVVSSDLIMTLTLERGWKQVREPKKPSWVDKRLGLTEPPEGNNIVVLEKGGMEVEVSIGVGKKELYYVIASVKRSFAEVLAGAVSGAPLSFSAVKEEDVTVNQGPGNTVSVATTNKDRLIQIYRTFITALKGRGWYYEDTPEFNLKGVEEKLENGEDPAATWRNKMKEFELNVFLGFTETPEKHYLFIRRKPVTVTPPSQPVRNAEYFLYKLPAIFPKWGKAWIESGKLLGNGKFAAPELVSDGAASILLKREQDRLKVFFLLNDTLNPKLLLKGGTLDRWYPPLIQNPRGKTFTVEKGWFAKRFRVENGEELEKYQTVSYDVAFSVDKGAFLDQSNESTVNIFYLSSKETKKAVRDLAKGENVKMFFKAMMHFELLYLFLGAGCEIVDVWKGKDDVTSLDLFAAVKACRAIQTTAPKTVRKFLSVLRKVEPKKDLEQINKDIDLIEEELDKLTGLTQLESKTKAREALLASRVLKRGCGWLGGFVEGLNNVPYDLMENMDVGLECDTIKINLSGTGKMGRMKTTPIDYCTVEVEVDMPLNNIVKPQVAAVLRRIWNMHRSVYDIFGKLTTNPVTGRKEWRPYAF